MLAHVFGLFTVICLMGCGGQVDGERRPLPGTGSTSGTGSASSSGSGGTGGQDWSSPLPECVPGFSLADANGRICNWSANGVCFEKRADACGCECRRTGGNTCSSGFPEPGARVEVGCF